MESCNYVATLLTNFALYFSLLKSKSIPIDGGVWEITPQELGNNLDTSAYHRYQGHCKDENHDLSFNPVIITKEITLSARNGAYI